MITFNLVLLIHFSAFLLYASTLVLQFPKQERRTGKAGRWLGIAILLTGVWMVILKYPHVNYYKIIPKTIIFTAISAFSAIYSNRDLPKRIYYLLLGLTIMASFIALLRT